MTSNNKNNLAIRHWPSLSAPIGSETSYLETIFSAPQDPTDHFRLIHKIRELKLLPPAERSNDDFYRENKIMEVEIDDKKLYLIPILSGLVCFAIPKHLLDKYYSRFIKRSPLSNRKGPDNQKHEMLEILSEKFRRLNFVIIAERGVARIIVDEGVFLGYCGNMDAFPYYCGHTIFLSLRTFIGEADLKNKSN